MIGSVLDFSARQQLIQVVCVRIFNVTPNQKNNLTQHRKSKAKCFNNVQYVQPQIRKSLGQYGEKKQKTEILIHKNKLYTFLLLDNYNPGSDQHLKS